MIEEVLIEIIRMVLELLGREHGEHHLKDGGPQTKNKCRRRRRSLVRTIGSSLPLAPVQRFHFQYVRMRNPERPAWLHQEHQFFEEDCEPAFIPTLSDLPWIVTATPNKHIRSRSEYRPVKNRKKRRVTMAVRPLHHSPPNTPRPSAVIAPNNTWTSEDRNTTSTTPEVKGHCSMEPDVKCKLILEPDGTDQCARDSAVHGHSSTEADGDDPKTMKKISALEEELEKLRAQIAMIVTLQSQAPPQDSSQSTPVAAAHPPPPSVGIPPPPPPPPPPCGVPPPPPPPPPPVAAPKLSAIDLIKQNRAKNKGKAVGSAPSGMPNMSDVLRGLGSVKLKSVARSPGGTPVRQPPKACEETDPAAIIAKALKRKFAQARLSCSPKAANKENIDFTGSPAHSPVHSSPKFGPHLLKPVNRAQPNVRQSRPLADINA